MSLCEQYLADRGITLETARAHGLESDDRIYSKKIKERLNRGLPKGYEEVL